jgi:hypothetical protein
MTSLPKKLNLTLLLAIALTGCAVSPDRFYADPVSLSDGQLCRTLNRAAGADPAFAADVRLEVHARGFTDESCRSLVSSQNSAIATGFLLGTAVATRTRHRHVGVGVGVGIAIPTGPARIDDTEWDWDQFHDQQRQAAWACRGVQSGQYTSPERCTGKAQTDWRWPQN